MSIDAFKSAISKQNGLAQANRFAFSVNPPEGVPTDQDLQFFVESVTLPGRSLSTTEYTNEKQTLKVPYTFIDGDVSVTFILSNTYNLKMMFDAWLELVFSSERHIAGYKDDYSQGSVRIAQIDKNSNPIYGVTLEKPYPISVSEITLANSSENDVSRFTVVFAYDKYIRDNKVDVQGSTGPAFAPTSLRTKVPTAPSLIDNQTDRIDQARAIYAEIAPIGKQSLIETVRDRALTSLGF